MSLASFVPTNGKVFAISPGRARLTRGFTPGFASIVAVVMPFEGSPAITGLDGNGNPVAPGGTWPQNLYSVETEVWNDTTYGTFTRISTANKNSFNDGSVTGNYGSLPQYGADYSSLSSSWSPTSFSQSGGNGSYTLTLSGLLTAADWQSRTAAALALLATIPFSPCNPNLTNEGTGNYPNSLLVFSPAVTIVDNPPGTPVLEYGGCTTHALYQPNGSGGSTLIRLSGWGGSGSGLNWIGAACAGIPVSDAIAFGGDFVLFLPVKCRSAVVRSAVFVPNWGCKSG